MWKKPVLDSQSLSCMVVNSDKLPTQQQHSTSEKYTFKTVLNDHTVHVTIKTETWLDLE